MIDAHIHYAASLGSERLNAMIEEQNLNGVALLCIPKGGVIPVEQDAFSFKAVCPVPVYIFGGLPRNIYADTPLSFEERVDREVSRLLTLGCTGIKMLEGKPDVRKNHPVPDFDDEVWENYWSRLEEEQLPIYLHVNDPEEFWDASAASDYVKKAGWLYDDSFINNEAQYTQMLHVLERHPRLRILFPHFYFMSQQLERLSKIMDAFPNVRIDVTPGIELYYNLSAQISDARRFFNTYQDRIIYGTDIGARALIKQEPVPLSFEESSSRIKLIRTFLETDSDYILASDGCYVVERPPVVMHGLGLTPNALNKIYEENFLSFIHH